MFPKPKRFEDRDYLDFIKDFECAVWKCERLPCDPHHVTTVGARGSDLSAVPLCRYHHNKIDSPGWGRNTFQKHYGINFAELQVFYLQKYIERLIDGQ